MPAEIYEWLMDVVDDYELGRILESRPSDLSNAIEVNLDDL